MVDYSDMFRADPRIKRQRRFADTLWAQALRPIQAPANQYGFNPLAEALQRLAAALGSNIAASAAEQRESEQRAARGRIMSEVLRAQQATVPEGGFFQETMGPVPGMPPVGPGMRTQFKINQAIDDQGRQFNIDPSDIELAGGDAATAALLGQQAMTKGREATEAARIRAAQKGLLRAQAANDPRAVDFYLSQISPESVAERNIADRLSREATAESQIGAAKLDMNWVIRKSDGKEVAVSDYQLSQNPDKYNDVPEVVNQGPIPSWVGEQYEDLNNKFALAQNVIETNLEALALVTETTLETGALTPIVTKIKGYLADLGVPVEQLTPALILQTIQNKKALLIRNPKSGLGLTGNTSDADRNFLVDSVIGLAKTNHANEALLIVDTAAQRKKQAELDLQMKWISKHPYQGLIGYRSSDAAKELKKQPLFTKAERARLDVLIETQKPLTKVGGVAKKTFTFTVPEEED